MAIGLLSRATLKPAITQTRQTASGIKGKSRNIRIPSVPPDKEFREDVSTAKPVEKENVTRTIFTRTRAKQEEEADLKRVVDEELELVAAHEEGEREEHPGNPQSQPADQAREHRTVFQGLEDPPHSLVQDG